MTLLIANVLFVAFSLLVQAKVFPPDSPQTELATSELLRPSDSLTPPAGLATPRRVPSALADAGSSRD